VALYCPEFSGRIFSIEASTDKITSIAPSSGICSMSAPLLRKVLNGRHAVGLPPVCSIPDPSYLNMYLVSSACGPNDNSAVLLLSAVIVTSPLV